MENESRQALVELLFLALYQDNHLSIDEDSALEKALRSLGWEPEERSGPVVGKAFAAVRAANASEETREAFLTERTSRLRADGHSAVALELLGRVLGSDGMTLEENRFLDRAEKLLGG